MGAATEVHSIHSDNPTDRDSYRPGRFCGPGCDLFEDPTPNGHNPDGTCIADPCPVHSWEPGWLGTPPDGKAQEDA